MTYKSSFLLVTLLLATSLSFAQEDYKDEADCKPIPGLKDGFYLGMQIGYDIFGFQQKLYHSPIRTNYTLNAVDWAFGAFAGFGLYFRNRYYLALEALGNFNGAKQGITLHFYPFNRPPISYNAKFNAQSSYGLSALPGLRINNASLVYLRLGYIWANINNKIKLIIPNGSTYASNRINAGGFNYGIGLETLLKGPLSLRLEFNHIDYGGYHIGTAQVDPKDNQVMLGFVYHPAL